MRIETKQRQAVYLLLTCKFVPEHLTLHNTTFLTVNFASLFRTADGFL